MRKLFQLVLIGCVLLQGKLLFAEEIQLIKDGKVVANATAIFHDHDTQELQDRLFKLTIIVNEFLTIASGDSPIRDQLGKRPNKIKITVVPDFNRDSYMLAVETTKNGSILKIGGNNIDHTERAVVKFLSTYLRDEEIKELEIFVNTVLDNQIAGRKGIKLKEPQLSKFKDLVYTQKEPEAFDVLDK